MRLILIVLLFSTWIRTAAQTLEQQFPEKPPTVLMPDGTYATPKHWGNPEPRLQSKFPRPYLELGATINPCGYKTFSATATAGVDFESEHFVFKASAVYDTAKKHTSTAIDNDRGHLVGFGYNSFYRFSNSWFLGAGMSWGKTISNEYTKEATYPKLIVGKDMESVRLQFAYLREENEITHYPTLVRFTPGPGQSQLSHTCHCGSGVNGGEAQLWYPNPRLKKHIFFHADLQLFVFHTTITDPYNVSLTNAQKSAHDWSGSLTYSMMYRF